MIEAKDLFTLKDMLAAIYKGNEIGQKGKNSVCDDIREIQQWFKEKYNMIIIPPKTKRKPHYRE